jgi:hypothetical protein
MIEARRYLSNRPGGCQGALRELSLTDMGCAGCLTFLCRAPKILLDEDEDSGDDDDEDATSAPRRKAAPVKSKCV